MNMMTQFNHNQQSMTSLEISELVQKRHDNVKRTIESLMGIGVISQPQIEDGIKSANGVIPKVYIFSGEQGKRDSIIVVAQLCPEFTARLVDRWQELERNVAQPVMDLNNPEFLRQALLGYTEKVIELEQKVQVLEPKAEALDQIADTSNTYCLRECAKTFGIRESDLIQILIDKKWIYREPSKTSGKSGKLQPHAQYVTNKVFINRISPVITNQYTGQEMVHTHMRVTAFGLTRITGMVSKVRKAQQVAA